MASNLRVGLRPATTINVIFLTIFFFLSSAHMRAQCLNAAPHKQALFGDLHIHTGLSADARLFGSKTRPADAYAFATGQPIDIMRDMISIDSPMSVTIDRPLDFAAVTDHAENIGAISLCVDSNSPAYDTESCRFVREPLSINSMAAFSEKLGRQFRTLYNSTEICGEDNQRCIAAVKEPWQEIQSAAAEWNEPCTFSTLIGYEYSPTDRGSNLHHNVIFRGDEVMDAPISSRYEPDPFAFYRQLKEQCNDASTGCRALAIPHNSNISNGKMLRLDYPTAGSEGERLAQARVRADMVPLIEIFQEKGDSECRNGLWNVLGETDEYCEFEKYRDWRGAELEDCQQAVGDGGFQNVGCVSRLDYARTALAAGIAEQQSTGVNSLAFGFVGATDNHLGTAADVEEQINNGIDRPYALLEPGRMSTGGVTGVWAEQNTRAAIFDAMAAREVFATSGPRIQPRFFAGWDIDPASCSNPGMIDAAYRDGVPMGGQLAMTDKTESPQFLVSALADAGSEAIPGNALQRLQIIKSWPGGGDMLHYSVYDVAMAKDAETASVDSASCARTDAGAASLCAVWQDPDYDPEQSAAYYLRVLETPSCRYTAYSCMAATEVDGAARLPDFCRDASLPKIIQERAWTSPIWLNTAASPSLP